MEDRREIGGWKISKHGIENVGEKLRQAGEASWGHASENSLMELMI